MKVDINVEVTGPNPRVDWDPAVRVMTITATDGTGRHWQGSIDELVTAGLLDAAPDPTTEELVALIAPTLGGLSEIAEARARQVVEALHRGRVKCIWF